MKKFTNVVAIPARMVNESLFSGGIYTSDGGFVSEAQHLRNGGRPVIENSPIQPFDTAGLERVERGIYGGFLFNHFGHFLIESLGRLSEVNGCGVNQLNIYFHTVWGLPDFQDESGFFRSTFRVLGIDYGRVRFIRKNMAFNELLIPGQSYGFHNLSSPSNEFISFLDGCAERIKKEKSYSFDSYHNVYVSRSKWNPAKGIIAGEDVFENFLRNEGWIVFHPEAHDFMTQLNVYSESKRLIFAEGSALHSLILLPKIDAEIAVIARRPSGLVNFTQQFSGFGKKISVFDSIEYHFMAGMPPWSGVSMVDYFQLSQTLKDLGWISANFNDWHRLKYQSFENALIAFLRSASSDKRFLQFIGHKISVL